MTHERFFELTFNQVKSIMESDDYRWAKRASAGAIILFRTTSMIEYGLSVHELDHYSDQLFEIIWSK